MKSKNKRVNYSGWTDQTLNDPSVESILDKFIRKPQPEKDDLKNDQLDLDQRSQEKDQPSSMPKSTSLLENEPPACQNNSLLESTSVPDLTSLPKNNSQATSNFWSSIEPVKGHLKLPHNYTDGLARLLDPAEQVIYLQLYRLSWGYGKDNCIIGLPKLAERANVSRSTAQQAIKKLIDKKLVEKIDWTIGYGKEQGTSYRLPIPSSLLDFNSLPNSSSLPDSTPIKEEDHDPIKKNHQSETMTIYKNLTGNAWLKSDQAAYEKIKHLSLQEISQLIKSTLEKAHQKPASLAYFVKAYLNPTQANPANKQAIKAKLAAIVERKREAHVGTRYTIADLTYDVKAECVREGIVFDNDLFNEVLEKR